MTDTVGHKGEAIAAKYYQQRGWLLLNHNYRTRMGEIDLILYKENTLVFAEVRQRGMARVVDTLLPGVVGFCAPVFDSDRRMVMGVVALGSAATFDAEWGGTVEAPLRAMARQLSADLGYTAP